jgi:peroxiredoxin
MMRHLLVLTFSVLVFAAGSLAQQAAPDFKVKASDGSVIELSKLKGKVVVINYWATWCGPCKLEIPGFINVYNDYKSKGLEIVGVSVDESGWSVVKPFLAKANITYPVVLADKTLKSAYGQIDAIPTTFFVNRKGMIVDHHVGYMSKEAFEEKVKGLLE